MQSVIVGFRYATSRCLALVGLSLISFLLILKDLPLFRTLVVWFYRQKRATTNNKHSCTHDSHSMHAAHNSSSEYQKQTCSDIWTNNILYQENIIHIIAINSYLQINPILKQTSCRHPYASRQDNQHTLR
jgi:hypothetical protein